MDTLHMKIINTCWTHIYSWKYVNQCISAAHWDVLKFLVVPTYNKPFLKSDAFNAIMK